jgi:diacylglycerol kinase family enzyme
MNEIHEKQPDSTNLHRMRVALIFNPSAGATNPAPMDILAVIHEMQAWKLIPEVFLVEDGCDLLGAVQEALAQGISLFVVCGGDGTISAVAGMLVGTESILGIVPTGTQNNIALSLDIPADLPSAIALLRTGCHIKVDVGMADCGGVITPFLELCSVGLGSALFPSADDILHGNLSRVGDFLATLADSAPAEIHLVLDGEEEIRALAHAVLVANMPFTGLNYQVGSTAGFNDGLLNVLLFADLSKLDLVGYMFKGVGANGSEDPRIQHYNVRRVEIDTQPPMPIMADGNALGEGRVHIEIHHRSLSVLVNKSTAEALPDPDAVPQAQTDAVTE